ncbi:Hypothetical predicted protein [Marmota monax]|uniref:Uncharacterized protein n=1 Tax=Marmota monax TaxID=9995 RepID=A0A5E4CUC4_MARMO|nr:hypothetical protein GHT09_017193 [Marmota monax]KAF7475260.1 hypothetical protein GHT09_013916 [Marmota monax]VTJ85417.1 Hypothetical predicted protein [Marmota monax]
MGARPAVGNRPLRSRLRLALLEPQRTPEPQLTLEPLGGGPRAPPAKGVRMREGCWADWKPGAACKKTKGV